MMRRRGGLERRAEQRQKAVAEELVDDAAVTIEYFDQHGECAIEPLDHLLRRPRPRARGEAAEIDEHDGDPADVARRLLALDQQPLDHLGGDMLAEQIGDAVTRGGRGDAGFELMPQLNAHRARQDAADQKHHAAHQLVAEFGCRLAGKTRRAIQHRHREQFGRGNKAREGGEPEVEPQRRENDEEKIGQRRRKSQRLRRTHPVHVQIQHKGRNAGLDQGGEIAPRPRHIAVHRQPPRQQIQHHEFVQQKRHVHPVQRRQLEPAMRDAAEHRRREDVERGHHRDQQRDRDDDRLDPQPLGQQDLARQGIAELGQHRRVAFPPQQAPQQLEPAVRSFQHGLSLNRACGGIGSPRWSWRAASGQRARSHHIADWAAPHPSA